MSVPLRLGSDDERQSEPLLVLVLAPLVAVAGLANRLAPQEEDLGDAFAGINLGRQRRRVTDLDRHLAPPLRLQGRYVHDDAAIVDEDPGLECEVAGLR